MRSKRLLHREDATTNMLTPEEAADYMGVVTRMISYYVKMGYIKAHYVLGNNKFYLVDRHEIDTLIPQIEERRHHVQRIDELKQQERNTPKDSNGKWMKRSIEAASVK
jgi:DNA-binding transcriptional MerR regulator